MAKRALGRGLKALIPDTPKARSGLAEIPVDRLRPNPEQPRRHFDDEALAELSSSIAHHGVLQPLLVSDDGFDGLVVKTAFDRIEIDPDRCEARVGAGVPTSRLVERLIDLGLGGLEFAAGLPGTVGGALAGNAGCFGRSLSDALTRATVIDRDGSVMEISDPEWFGFDYRESRLLKREGTLTEAVFNLERQPPETLLAEAEKCLAMRAERHPPPGTKTAGSYFKNLPPANPGEQRRSAGGLLDRVGAKNLSVGDAAVFERHANIVINRGNAKAEQVLALADEMARRVLERFDVELFPEVRFVGKRPGQKAVPLR